MDFWALLEAQGMQRVTLGESFEHVQDSLRTIDAVVASLQAKREGLIAKIDATARRLDMHAEVATLRASLVAQSKQMPPKDSLLCLQPSEKLMRLVSERRDLLKIIEQLELSELVDRELDLFEGAVVAVDLSNADQSFRRLDQQAGKSAAQSERFNALKREYTVLVKKQLKK